MPAGCEFLGAWLSRYPAAWLSREAMMFPRDLAGAGRASLAACPKPVAARSGGAVHREVDAEQVAIVKIL
jgi:hypothetical protein